MTPRNETEEDLEKERHVAALIARRWGCEVKKISEDRLYLADYAVVNRGEIKAFVEIRCRRCRRDTYPTIYLPLQKVIWAEGVFAASAVPYLYVVCWEMDNAVGYVRVTGHFEGPKRIVWVKRQTESENHPDGPVLEVDTSDFIILDDGGAYA